MNTSDGGLAEPGGLLARIRRVVERDFGDHVDFLRELISTDTRSGREQEGQRLVAARMKNLGCEVDVFEPDPERLGRYEDFNAGHSFAGRPNVVGVLGGGEEGHSSIILNGHVDTVEPASDWTRDPYDPSREADLLYGLGSSDMKAGLVGTMAATKVLRELEHPLPGRLILQSVVDEEAGGGNGTLACVDRGYRAQAAIVAEPTRLEVCAAQTGSLAIEIRVLGRAAHANTKWRGVSAIDEALPILESLKELETRRSRLGHPLLPPATVNVGRIDAGTGATSVADGLRLEACLSYHPGERRQLRDEIQDRIGGLIGESAWLSEHPPVLRFLHDVDGYQLAGGGGDAFIDLLQNATSEVVGTPPPVTGFPAGSDGRLLNNVAGIPTAIFGPGSLDQAHVGDEHVSLSEFRQYVEALSLLLWRWLGTPRSTE